MKTTRESRLVRRKDGMLDLVFLLVAKVHTPEQRERRFLLVLRPRSGPLGKSTYLEHRGSGGIMSTPQLFGLISSQVDQSWHFSACEPVVEFAEEIKQKGLWEPAAAR